jgi:hypothetical protein
MIGSTESLTSFRKGDRNAPRIVVKILSIESLFRSV